MKTREIKTAEQPGCEWFRRKVRELGEALRRLPADRQEQLQNEMNSGRNTDLESTDSR